MAKRDIIREEILKGGATKESLMAAAEVDEKGLASQMTYLRLTGFFPVKGDDGVFTTCMAEEWEARKASSGGGAAKALSPKERFEKAEKRSKRAASAYDNAKTRKEANPDNRLAELTFIKAEAEMEMSEILLGQAQEALDAAPVEEEIESDDAVEDIEETEIDDDIEETEIDDDSIEDEIEDMEEDFE